MSDLHPTLQSDLSRQSPIVWSIGGIDPTGLAGISADNRANAVSGAHGVNIVTSVTAQNSNAFFSQHAIPIEVLEQQWLALIEQCWPVVIKIGLLVSPAQVTWLANKLRQLKARSNTQQPLGNNHKALWVIYDPVMRASSDAAPVFNNMLSAIKETLLPWVDLLTPNLPEAILLSGKTPACENTLLCYTQALSSSLHCQVLLKGGHVHDVFDDVQVDSLSMGVSQGQCVDYYARPSDLNIEHYAPEPSSLFTLSQPFDQQINRRGSGCTLASLIAGFVANEYTFCDAIILSNGVMKKSYSGAQPLGTARGGAIFLSNELSHAELPQITCFNGVTMQDLVESSTPFAVCPDKLGLYPVVTNVQWLARLLKQGVKTIQLRAKDQGDSEVEPEIIAAIALGKQYNARVFINDYWPLAVKHGAYGVHLGQEDMLVADLNAIKKAGLRLGLSTHGVFEAQWASQMAPSYMALGHIYATQTKDMSSRPQGLEKLGTQVCLFEGALPLVAIGGITASRVANVVQTKIGSVALVTAITHADNPEEVTQQLLATVGYGAVHD